MQPARQLVVLAVASGAAQVVLMCVAAWLLARVLFLSIFEHVALARVGGYLLALLGLTVLRIGLAFEVRRASYTAAVRVVGSMRRRLLDHVCSLGPMWLRSQSSGELVTQIMDGVDALVPYYARVLPQTALAAVIPLIIVFAAFPADWVTGLILLVTAPLIPWFMVLVGNAAEHASQKRWLHLRRMGAFFLDTLGGLTTLRQLNAAQRTIKAITDSAESYRHETMAVLRIAFLSSLVLEFFATISIAVVAVWVGFRLFWGDLDFQRGMFVLLLVPEFYLPLRALGTLRHSRMEALAAAASISELLGIALPAKGPKKMGNSGIADRIGIGLQDVRFQHAEGRGVLKQVSFDVPEGQHTALVGPTGGGKSTLLDLLLGFAQPQQGRILVNGKDLAEFDMDVWRQRVSWVPQRAHVFDGSFRDNLLIANPQASNASLYQVVEACALDMVLEDLAQSWDTPLGERGYGLSGGELQRLALARALLRDSPLLLLDEPMQHLDADMAQQILTAIRPMLVGRTVLWVAHDLDASVHADHLVVLDAGTVVEQGTPLQLSQSGGLYARLLSVNGNL